MPGLLMEKNLRDPTGSYIPTGSSSQTWSPGPKKTGKDVLRELSRMEPLVSPVLEAVDGRKG